MKSSVSSVCSVAAVVFLCACGQKPATAPTTTTPPAAEPDALRSAAAAAGKRVGTAVQSSLLNDPRYSAVFARQGRW